MAGILTPLPITQWFDDTGKPLSAGLVYTYAAGSTSLQNTYSDSALLNANPNPLTLDAQGKGTFYLDALNYKFDVQTAAGASIDGYPRDNVSGIGVGVPLTVALGGTGKTTLTSNGVLIGAGTAAIAPTAAGTTGQLLAGVTSAAPTFQTAALVGASMLLVKANNGTDQNAAATTVDSVALPVLTANDTVIVELYFESATQATGAPYIYHVTDAANLVQLLGSIAIGNQVVSRVVLKQQQGAASKYMAVASSMLIASTRYEGSAFYSASALWTAAWTIGLRHGGVTAGGTFKYQWSVYVLKGQ